MSRFDKERVGDPGRTGSERSGIRWPAGTRLGRRLAMAVLVLGFASLPLPGLSAHCTSDRRVALSASLYPQDISETTLVPFAQIALCTAGLVLLAFGLLVPFALLLLRYLPNTLSLLDLVPLLRPTILAAHTFCGRDST